MNNHLIQYLDWNLAPYSEAWQQQEELFDSNVKGKLENKSTENYFIVCEHPHVYTLGKSGNSGNMLLSEELLTARGATFVRTNRGGDITYHGPGQVVGYPIIDLELFHISLRQYIYQLEEVIISLLSKYGIQAEHNSEATGVWIDVGNPQLKRKICAIGVKASRQVTMHGFALNVSTDLSYFQAINPCGFVNGQVASIHGELAKRGVDPSEYPSIETIKQQLYKEFCSRFHAF